MLVECLNHLEVIVPLRMNMLLTLKKEHISLDLAVKFNQSNITDV